MPELTAGQCALGCEKGENGCAIFCVCVCVLFFKKLKKIQISEQYIIYDMKILWMVIYTTFNNLHEKLLN